MLVMKKCKKGIWIGSGIVIAHRIHVWFSFTYMKGEKWPHSGDMSVNIPPPWILWDTSSKVRTHINRVNGAYMNDILQQRLDQFFEVHHARSKQTQSFFCRYNAIKS